jgi:beta-xylosidase
MRIGFTLALLLLAFTTSAVPARGRDTLLGAGDFADPFVLREKDTYYAFATGTRTKHLQVAVAHGDDLSSWTLLPDALPTLPAWAVRSAELTWAPSLLRRGSAYVLYYTAPDSVSGFQCISRAVSAKPEGPYVDESSAPFVCDQPLCGSIDPSPFVDRSGRAYLLWKSDENSAKCHSASRIWSQPLTDDGLAVTGSPARLLGTDRAWERPLIEAPSMVQREGRFFLFYSASGYESADYAIGYATCSGPLGPCEKATLDRPFVASSKGLLGPGGQEFFEDAQGATWMTYHAWSPPRSTYASGGARSLRFARVGFERGAPELLLPLR